jgi:hypothetical protein
VDLGHQVQQVTAVEALLLAVTADGTLRDVAAHVVRENRSVRQHAGVQSESDLHSEKVCG